MIKKSIEITPGIEPLYGTRDENLRLLEDSLNVTIDLRSDGIHVTGTPEDVGRVQQVFADFDHLRKAGLNLHNGELHGMLKLVVSDPGITLRGLVDAGKQRSAGVKRMVQPRSPNQKKYVESIEQSDMTFGLGPGRNRQNLSCGRHGGLGPDGQEGQPHHPGPPGGRGR